MSGIAWLALLIRLVIGAQLSYSGWAKATAFEWWRDLVVQMDIFPFEITGVLAGALPGIELVLGITLILGLFQRASAILASVLFLGFMGMMIHLVLKDAPTMCGCFGPGSEYPVDWNHVVLDGAWALCAIALVFMSSYRFSLSR
ncbi:MAG: putative membrane protein YphA (DoxX/SURF4 family) [Planctomycetota bacterium]|jgi:uncharacterized membrane protein YphA (DoxX/SURF4 family)